MKSITIHNLDDRASEKLSEVAKAQGLSLNKTIKKILYESLGLKVGENKDHSEDFSEFFGNWSKEEGKIFEAAIQDFEKIDREDWN
ncbi:hypothetical protein JW935_18735 [candidate division KSB1 bacterium]|nr:hypothetical protein [candidate division KSB1 bacterium]